MPNDLLKDAKARRLFRAAEVKGYVADKASKSWRESREQADKQEVADARTVEITDLLKGLHSPGRAGESLTFEEDVEMSNEIEKNSKTKKDLLEKLGPTKIRKLIELGIIGSDGLLNMRAVRGHMAKNTPKYTFGIRINPDTTPSAVERARSERAWDDKVELGDEADRAEAEWNSYRWGKDKK